MTMCNMMTHGNAVGRQGGSTKCELSLVKIRKNNKKDAAWSFL